MIRFTEKIAEQLGFTYNKFEEWTDPTQRVILHFDEEMINRPGAVCYMYVNNNDKQSIGSLDFYSLEDFITMLRLCGKEVLAIQAEQLLNFLKINGENN